jgi:uroporphyrin-3 C-methyltransferase
VADIAKKTIITESIRDFSMADDNTRSEDAKASTTLKSKRVKDRRHEPEIRPRRGSLAGGLALIFSAIALAAAGYLWYALLLQRPDLLTTDVVGNLDKLKSETVTLRESVESSGLAIDDVKANQDSIRGALDKIQNDLSRHRTEWLLAESEQLLVIANNRLQLARDVRSALAALRAADAQLNQISNPSLLPVRREVAREIASLEAIDKIDVGGISLKLGSLAETADRLPVAPDVSRRSQALDNKVASIDTPDNGGWRISARNLWQDMLSLVRVRTDLATQRPLLPPEQEYFLRENLKLMLFAAQAALLQGNVAVFQQNIKSAEQLLKEYYDTSTQVVIGMQTELEKMRSSKLVAELPDISRSLATLRSATGTRGATP